MGREASIDVVRDEDGGMGLSVYENFQHDTPVPLVDITNNFDAPMTVTVTLVQYNSNDDHLYVDGSDVGDTYTVQLTSGETETIDLLAERRCFWWFCFPSNIAFEVSATVQGTDARATRSISIGAYQ